MRSFYLRNKNGQIQGCVASELEENRVVYCYTSWNEADDEFNKNICRQMAEGRVTARNRPTDREYKIFNFLPVVKGQVKTELLTDLLSHHDIPSRVRKAAQLWLKTQKKKKETQEAIAKLASVETKFEAPLGGKLAS